MSDDTDDLPVSVTAYLFSGGPEAARTVSTVDGKVIGVPALVDNLALIYNKKLFDDAKVPYPPTDWDDVLDPQWTGRVLIRDPIASGTMRTIFGMVIDRSLRATGDTAQGFDWLLVIDDDPEIIDELRQGDVTCIRGDASDPEVLRSAGADRARVISSTIRRPRDNEALLRSVHGVPILVRVFEDDDARWVEELGGTPILYSEEAARDFSNWFREREGRSGVAGSLPVCHGAGGATAHYKLGARTAWATGSPPVAGSVQTSAPIRRSPAAVSPVRASISATRVRT